MEPHAKESRESIRYLADDLHEELSKPFDKDDPIRECGEAAISILESNPDESLRLAHENLHVFPFKDVPDCWRRLYCEASLWKTWKALREVADFKPGNKEDLNNVNLSALEDDLGKIIALLDMCLIMTNAPRRYETVQDMIRRISEHLSSQIQFYDTLKDGSANGSPTRTKCNLVHPDLLPAEFKHSNPCDHPPIHQPIHKAYNLSLPEFQSYLVKSHKDSSNNGPLPLIIVGGASHWPALENSLWKSPSYFLSRTSMGHRLVPVELGQSYTDNGWGQNIVKFRQFMNDYMLKDSKKKGYLAQHDLFTQIPKLKEDICIPDYCFSEPPSPRKLKATSSSVGSSSASESPGLSKFEEDQSENSYNTNPPLLNIWMGSAHTVSPAHTDPHHNILVQVVGHKYVRLFAPSESSKIYPLSSNYGVDMSNTSGIDIGQAMKLFEGWDNWNSEDDTTQLERDPIECEDDPDSLREDFNIEFPNFANAAFSEGILSPGDCLYIPKGWWHYVRSLSPSISVSFWWN